jgi:hypothetical protein
MDSPDQTRARGEPGRALLAHHLPASWAAVLNWISDPKRNLHPAPDEQALQGLQPFLDTVRFENTTIDARMLDALTGHAVPSSEP